jgi:late competence protein required for DNA uptake (superfamily II DNA/RNA helicase)
MTYLEALNGVIYETVCVRCDRCEDVERARTDTLPEYWEEVNGKHYCQHCIGKEEPTQAELAERGQG